MLTSNSFQAAPPREMSEMVRIGLEADRVATEKMPDDSKRMGIKITPQMTLGSREANADAAEGEVIEIDERGTARPPFRRCNIGWSQFAAPSACA